MVGLSERNLLGRGKQAAVARRASLDRDETFLFYRDPRVLGTRIATAVQLSNRSDGGLGRLTVNRPFFSLATKWAFGVRIEGFDQLDPIYANGERIAALRHIHRLGEIGAARAIARRATSAVRLHVAYRKSDDDVGVEQRRFGFAQLGLTLRRNDFVRMSHVNRFERSEDFNLGDEAGIFVGLSTKALGGEEDPTYFVRLFEQRGLALGLQGFLSALVSWQARHRHHTWENSLANARVRLTQKLAPRRLLLAKADFRYGSNLDPELQVRLGAESGLRGYPVRQFNGDRSLLLSAESRFFIADVAAAQRCTTEWTRINPCGAATRLSRAKPRSSTSAMTGLAILASAI